MLLDTRQIKNRSGGNYAEGDGCAVVPQTVAKIAIDDYPMAASGNCDVVSVA